VKAFALALALGLAACGPGDAEASNDTVARPALELTGRLVDRARLFDAASADALEQRLAKLEQATSDQLVVVSVPSLEGQPIDQFAKSLGNRWEIGRGDVDNGVLMLVAPNERKVWIATGTGLEGLVTDQRAQAIVNRMLPDFEKGNLRAGIERGIGEIEQVLRSDTKRPRPKAEPYKEAA
jgi:uncharacterized protein